MERIHGVLRPRGKESDPPRDVVCCVIDFQLKEEILHSARANNPLTHNNADIQLFQDLSNITLQRRRELRPVLEVLHAKEIPYRWKFPFGLLASASGQSALLRVPEDLRHFCDTLGIPFTAAPEWYAEFRTPTAKRSTPGDDSMETQDTRYRRQCSPSEPRAPLPATRRSYAASPTTAPQSRRARRDH